MDEKELIRRMDQLTKDVENIKTAVKAWCKILEQNFDNLEEEAMVGDYYGKSLGELKQTIQKGPDMDMSKDGWS